MLNDIHLKMIEYYKDDPEQCQHFAKVHSYARLIAQSEGLSKEELYITETAALVHDIGIKEARRVYASSAGKYQEELGPAIAQKLLEELNENKNVIDRVCFLVSRHHTYTGIDGADYQILVEADFIVNAYEGSLKKDTLENIYKNIFKTKTGKFIFKNMFL